LSTLKRQISEDRKFKTSPTLECKSIATTGNASARKKITYPGTGNNSQFSFGPLGRNVNIVEQAGGATTSTKQLVWCSTRRCEERYESGIFSIFSELIKTAKDIVTTLLAVMMVMADQATLCLFLCLKFRGSNAA